MSRQFARDAVWIMVGRLGIGVALILTTRLLTDQVSPVEYGYFALLISLLGLAFNITFQPMNLASQRFIPPALNTGTVAGVRATLLRLMRLRYALAVGVILAGYLGLTAFDIVPFRWPLLVGVLVLTLMTGQRSLYTFMAEAVRNQKLSSVWKVTEGFLKLACALSLVTLFRPSADAILIGFCLGMILPSAYFLWRYHATGFTADANTDAHGREITRFAIPLTLAGGLNWFIGFGDRFILSAYGDAAEVGIYYAIYGLMSFPMLQMGGIFSTLIQPIFFRHEAAQQRNLILWLGALSIWLLPVLVMIWFFSDLIAQLLLGTAFRGGSDYMIWIAAGYGLLSLNMALDARILSAQKTRLLTTIIAIAAVANFTLNLILVPDLGAKGAGMATFFTFVVQFALSSLAVIYLSWIAKDQSCLRKAP
ncbi:MAG: oligosaccharide flippase family protein [Cyanobacteria bacterium P01_E01_bin.43]